MDTKGHSDIDYNRIVHGEYDYMGRGWNLGGHTKDHNSISYGVCVIGQDGDATKDDFATVRAIYDEVCATLGGRQLVMTDHRNVLGENYTDCPGDEIDAWVDGGMITGGVDDMGYDRNTAWRMQEYLAGKKTIVIPLTDNAGSPPEITESNLPQLQWDRIEQLIESLAEPVPVEIDYDELAEKLRPIVAQEVEKAVRGVLGGLDGATP